MKNPFFKASVALAAIFLLPLNAMAAEDTTESPNSFSWSGVYLGASAGYVAQSVSVSATDGITTVGPLTATGEAFLGGIFAGYNHQFDNNLVIGAEAEIHRSEFNVSGFSIGPRVGYAIDRALFFGEAGYAFYHEDAPIVGEINLHGFYVGAGVDYALTDKVFAGLKYDFADFSPNSIQVGPVTATVNDYKIHSFKARIGVKF